jgi:AbrB family looped-hinge helix DNA binding protein
VAIPPVAALAGTAYPSVRESECRNVALSREGHPMSVSVIRAKGQVTIPQDIREAAHLEAGDHVEVEITADGILLRPKQLIDSSQAWFWTDRWQAMEREASEDIDAGRVTTFESPEAFLESLDD